MKNTNKKSGITLIALIITIIVMLILVAVTISMAVNGGLFGYAGNAVKDIEVEKQKELDWTNLSNNLITDDLIDKFLNNTGESLVETITSDDYGKSINYTVTVKGTTLTNWKVFLNDGNNIYIIYGDYLENRLMPIDSNKVVTAGEYGVESKYDDASYIATWMTNNTTWQQFASGLSESTATGGPTANQLFASMGKTIHRSENVTINNLYVPRYGETAICNGYWICDYSYYMSSTFQSYINNLGKYETSESGGYRESFS